MSKPHSPHIGEPDPNLPWWRVGMVWFALAGPAIVVIAGLVTAAIAMHGADPVLRIDSSSAVAETPAVQARNHAATLGQKD
ncbi:MAG: hypothetical protein WA210_01750 [Burkholderiaceae bacterium]